ncbi:MAG: endolytic transglycosylase MltG, partial [Bryobacteraceae bacterium]
MKRALIGVAIVAALAAGALAWSIVSAYRGFSQDVFVQFDRGTSAIQMGRQLARAGVIRFPWQFWIERALHSSAKLQAGEYRFSEPASAGEVFDRIARGDVYYFEFTVPEGSNMFDIARSLEAAGAMPAADFLRAASDPAPVRDIAPSAVTLEGYLFPETYRLTHATTAHELVREMIAQFRNHWKKLAAGEDANVTDTVTLASLIEKETAVSAERPLIAGVFNNRLRIGMPLQCDPTTIYAALLDNRYRDTIHQSDLASRNPYNTYQH